MSAAEPPQLDPANNPVDAQWRPEYRGGLLPDQLPPAPWALINQWLTEAAADAATHSAEPGAVTLATVGPDSLPDARIVLLKKVTPTGFTFYSDNGSAKAQHLNHNPQAALLFYWPQLFRQLRVRGQVELVPDAEAAEYFASRPPLSQVAAHTSLQSTPIGSRQELADRFSETANRLGDHSDVPPATWQGYRVLPQAVEFWSGDANRLHDRAQYCAAARSDLATPTWTVTRLQP